jgi:lysophospholipase L1-like esterase
MAARPQYAVSCYLMLVAVALVVAAVAAEAEVAETPALRLMPLGDSITQWQCGTLGNATSAANGRGDVASFGGYRGPLFESLHRQWGSLYSFESVGGQHGCGSHEGHSGWTCEMLADIIVESATAYKPDVVMLMCGTNDLW